MDSRVGIASAILSTALRLRARRELVVGVRAAGKPSRINEARSRCSAADIDV